MSAGTPTRAEIIEAAVVDILDLYYADDRRFDLHLFLDRVEEWTGVDLGSNLDSPEITEIRRMIRRARRGRRM